MITTTVNQSQAPTYTGLRNRTFDRAFAIGIPAIALVSVGIVMRWPSMLWTIIAIDLWMLGYQHVIATWTRIGFDRESLAKYWPLITILPPVVFGVVLALGLAGGLVLLNTIYFYWLWFHYVRQSEGVSRAYAARCGARAIVDQRMMRFAFYATPTAALLTISTLGQKNLLGVPLYLFSLPIELLLVVWAVTLGALILSTYNVLKLRRSGHISREYLIYLASHHFIFIATYGVIRDTTVAWLGLNIWHNLQYLSFVWLSHQHRFKGKVSNGVGRVLSTLALPRNLWLYLLACLTLTFLFYMLVENVVGHIPSLGLPEAIAAIVIYQTINFHHYVVDAIIWRRPRARHASSTDSLAAATPATTPMS